MGSISFNINGQIITRSDNTPIVQDSLNYLYAQFDFSEEWTGQITAVFKGKDGEAFNVLVDESGECLVPWEVLTQTWFEVSVFCGNLITANVVRIYTIESGYEIGQESREPTPDVYNQIIEALDNIDAFAVSYENEDLGVENVGDALDVLAQGGGGGGGTTPNIHMTAEVDATTGTPDVEVTKTGTLTNPIFNLAFTGLKGAQGPAGERGPQGEQGPAGIQGPAGETGSQGPKGDTGATPIISASATVSNTTGTPSVNVSKSGTDEAPSFSFAFSNLKGETGSQGPQGIQGIQGPTGPQGPQGEAGADGSVVSVTQTLSSGTKIGEITIDGTSTDLFAPSGGEESEKKCVISIVDDDGTNRTSDYYTGILSYLNGKGIPLTLAVPVDAPSKSSGTYNLTQLHNIVNAGNEVVMHGQTSTDTTRTQTLAEFQTCVDASVTWAETNNFTNNIYVYPGGTQPDLDSAFDDKLAYLENNSIRAAYNVNTSVENHETTGFESWYTYMNGADYNGVSNRTPFVTMPNGNNKTLLLNRNELKRDRITKNWWKEQIYSYIERKDHIVLYMHSFSSEWQTAGDDGKTTTQLFEEFIDYLVATYGDKILWKTLSDALDYYDTLALNIGDTKTAIKDSVTVTQTLSSGTKIAEVSVDGTVTNLYAPSGGGSASDFDKFCDNIDIDYAFDSTTNANYTVFRIYKNKLDGTKQYPFVRYKNMRSSLELAEEEGWFLTITGGLFDNTGASPVHAPDGVVIEDSEVLNNEVNVLHAGSYPLLIDSDGNLSYAQPDETGLDIMENYNNIVSAVGGWQPIIVNYQPLGQMAPILQWSQNMQRMIIGQFGNGDYAIITCEGRNFDHSDGWTMPEAISICQKLGLKFAYNLDGGGSTEAVIGEKQFNTVYENVKGRKLSTFIVFTGSTSFNPEIGTTLSNISATKTDKEYTVGDTLDISDLVVIANYSDGTHANVTSSATINTSSVDMTTAGTYSISVSYTQGGVTKTASISIVVSNPVVKTLTSITATKTQTSYDIGDTLSTSDIVVTAHYSDSTSTDVTSSATIDTSDVDMSAQGTYLIVISYTEDGITETTSISISVGESVVDYDFLYGYSLTGNSGGTAIVAFADNKRVTALTQTPNEKPININNTSTQIGYMIPVPANATAVTATVSSGYIPAIRLVTSDLSDDYNPGWVSGNVAMASFMPNRFSYLIVNVKNSGNTTIPSDVDTSSWSIEFTPAENRDYFVQIGYPMGTNNDGSIQVQTISATRSRAIILDKVQNAAEVKGYTDSTNTKSATLGYLIPIPSTATSVTAYLPSDNAQSYRYIAGLGFWNIQDGVLKRALDTGWGSETTTTKTFTAGAYQYVSVNIKNSSNTELSPNAPINDWTVTFE